jgi:diaminopimelate epimerase
MHFAKYHALGNDYLVIEAGGLAEPLAPGRIRRLCDRHRGPGADGVLLREPGAARHRLRIFNPDGSEAEKSGNGLRIFARYLFDRGAVGEDPFPVELPGGTVRCRILARGRSVAVELGRVSFRSDEIPVAGPPREVLREHLEAEGRVLEFSAVSVGNPHCVILCDAVSEAEARALGPALELHPLFPRRTNVQLVRVVDRTTLHVEIWERGAGYTLASGTSACAAAAVAHRLGRCDPAVRVVMPGGALAVEIGAAGDVTLTGPVTRVAEGTVFPEMFDHERDVETVPDRRTGNR